MVKKNEHGEKAMKSIL